MSARASLNEVSAPGAFVMLSPWNLVFLSGRCLVQRPTCDFCEQVWRRVDSAKDLLRACAEEATLTRTTTLIAGALVPVMRWTVFLSWLRHCRRVQHSGQTALKEWIQPGTSDP